MILEDLYKIAQKGSEKPLLLWLDEFRELASGLVGPLEKIFLELTDGTEVKKNVSILIKLLKEKEPNELELAQALYNINDVFSEGVSIEHNKIVSDYIFVVMEFINLAKTSEFGRRARKKLLDVLSKKKQQEFDKKLFVHEGMTYCLEYYLAIHKAIQDAPTEEMARKYLESTEVNLGFGSVPGLWIDFSRDEVLSKFIYAILNDDLRQRLMVAYFDTKIVMMKIKINYNKQGICEVNYNGITLKEIKEIFKKLIFELLETFSLLGVERLSSLFFKPYGNKPLINDVIRRI